MSAALDFEGVARAALSACPDLLRRWFPAGTLRGREFVVGNLRGDRGDSLSINIDTGRWADFAAGERGGDLVALYAAMHRLSQGEAARRLGAELAVPAASAKPSAEVIPMPKRGAADWQPIMPVPFDAPAPPAEHPKHGLPVHVAEVRDAAGALLHLICRFQPPEGRKQVVPLTYGTLDGRTGWHWKAPPAPRPLYGLDRLAAHPERPVLVVEGEPKRDAAERLVGDRLVVISWPNGADGIGRADWRPLAGRDVLVWPDADSPGRAAAAAVVNVLRASASSIYTIDPPEDAPKGWDLADAEREGWTGEQVWARISDSIARANRIRGNGAAAPALDDFGEPPPPEPEGDAWPFRCLGYDRDRFYFLPVGAPRVLEFSARDLHNAGELVKLAPLSWWEGAFQGRDSFSTRNAGNALMRACERVGVYDPDRLRGRGVWLDEGRVVVHLGDRLLCDGQEVHPGALRSRFLYEAARPLPVEIGEPASAKQAAGLLRLCCEVAWEDPDRDGRLLAGWLVAAMACGAMPWRPHLWITSEAGQGKTWVLDNIVKPVLSGLALLVQGKTTEAGLRGALRLDARPVIFDEAETQNEQDRARMQQVLDLARAASSEDGADVIKGTRDGGSTRYRIRSCFAFSSINLGLAQAADESRTIVLSIAPDPDKARRAEAFDRLKAVHAEVMTPGFAAALLTRTLGLLPVIRHNAEVLATAIARSGASRRTGDTLGVVLACAYSLTSRAQLDAAAAEEWLAARAWVRETARAKDSDPEWRRALLLLMQSEVRLTTGNGRPVTTTLGELVEAVTEGSDAVGVNDADATLRRMGIRVYGRELRIANSSEAVRKAFVGTPWAAGWRETLARAPGARRNVATRFTSTLQDKAVAMPLEALGDA